MTAQASQYSIPGYLQALQFRTRKTILVEGIDDAKILARLIASRFVSPAAPQPFLLDTAQILQSPPGTVLGNRAKVEAVDAQVRNSNTDFVGLLDRDHGGFCFTDRYYESHPIVRKSGNSLLITRGHSIECYLLEGEAIRRYLELMHPEVVLPPHVSVVSQQIPRILSCALAITASAHNQQLIGRMDGIFDEDSWAVLAGAVALDIDRLCSALQTRGAAPASVAAFRGEYALASTLNPDVDFARWNVHGHVGTAATWSAIGSILKANGVPASVYRKVATGDRDVKLRLSAHAWADGCAAAPDAVEHPRELIAWLA